MDTNQVINKLKQLKASKQQQQSLNTTKTFAESLTGLKNILVGAMSDLTYLSLRNNYAVTVKNFPKQKDKQKVEVVNFPKQDKRPEVEKVEVVNQQKLEFPTHEITTKIDDLIASGVQIPPELKSLKKSLENAGKINYSCLEDILKAVQSLKLDPKIEVKQPKIEIPAPIVNIPASKPVVFPKEIAVNNLDLTEIVTKLEDLITEFQYSQQKGIHVTNPGDFPVSTTNTRDLAKEAKQLPDNHNVTVSNQVTGFATADNQTNSSQITKIKGATSDTTWQIPRIDASTHTLQVLDYEHHEIHAGSHFFYYDYDGDVDTAAPKYYRLTTANTTKWIHIQFGLQSEGSGTWQLFENPTINAAGTTATVFNNDRNSLTASTLTVAYDATTTNDGTQIKVWRTGSGTNAPSRAGSESRSSVEIILRQNEDYVLKFTPDADNAKTKVEFLYYEHTNRTA